MKNLLYNKLICNYMTGSSRGGTKFGKKGQFVCLLTGFLVNIVIAAGSFSTCDG